MYTKLHKMCTAFGVLKNVNISNQNIRMDFLRLILYFQLFTTTTWVIFAPYFNQSINIWNRIG